MFDGGLVLIFGRDQVWKIDRRSEGRERDADGNPIRTEQWDKAHRLQGIIMIVVAFVLAVLIYFFSSQEAIFGKYTFIGD